MGQRADELTEQTSAAREDIEQTRAEMSSTIDAIQDRLDPEVLSEQAKDTAHDVTDYAIREAREAAREITDHAVEQAKEAVREVTGQATQALRDATLGKVEHMAQTATETAGGWRQGVMETIKANPMPAALVGLGLGWMLLNRPSGASGQRSSAAGAPSRTYPTGYYGSPSGYGNTAGRAGFTSPQDNGSGAGSLVERAQDSAGTVVGQVQETASSVVDTVKDTTGEVIGQVQDTSGQVLDQVQEQASRAQTFLQRQLEENPLIVGAVAVAIGGVLAGTVRPTPREDKMMGDVRDRLVQSAQEVTQETMHKVGRVVDEAQSAAADEAQKQELVSRS